MQHNPIGGLPPVHPGALLREDVIPAFGRPKVEIAQLLGVSRQTLYDILGEKQPITAEMAVRVGKLCGNGPELWLSMQRAYDLAKARVAMADAVKDIPTLAPAE